MTNHELLELAAKAAGIDFIGWDAFRDDFAAYDAKTDVNFRWNPLTDDGDALRLLATKEMCIDFMNQRVIAGDNSPEILIDFLDGDYKRAIVMAAAEGVHDK